MLIGEVAQRSGISARMLRHYDRTGLVRPSQRTASGYRSYAEADLRRLFRVEALRSLGLSLAEIGEALEDVEGAPAVEALISRTRQRLEQERALLARLERVRRSGPEDWSEVLRTISLMRGLETGGPSMRARLALSASAPDAHVLAEAALAETDVNAAGALQWALARAGDDTVPELSAALQAEDPERRRRAVAALEKIGTPRASAALAAAQVSSDPVVQTRAMIALGRAGSPEAIPGLAGLVAAGSNDVEAAEALAALATQTGQAGEVARALTRHVDGADVPARRRLAAALAEVLTAAPEPPVRQALAALSSDPDRGVALTAALASSPSP